MKNTFLEFKSKCKYNVFSKKKKKRLEEADKGKSFSFYSVSAQNTWGSWSVCACVHVCVRTCVHVCVLTEHSHLAMSGWGVAEQEQSSVCWYIHLIFPLFHFLTHIKTCTIMENNNFKVATQDMHCLPVLFPSDDMQLRSEGPEIYHFGFS